MCVEARARFCDVMYFYGRFLAPGLETDLNLNPPLQMSCGVHLSFLEASILGFLSYPFQSLFFSGSLSCNGGNSVLPAVVRYDDPVFPFRLVKSVYQILLLPLGGYMG